MPQLYLVNALRDGSKGGKLMNFKGTIIITDPCYLIPNDADYDRTNYGKQLDKLGFTTFLVADTGFGDWDNVITKDDGTILGNFCADSGQVCVVLAEDAIKYYPETSQVVKLKSSPCYAIIEDFDGDIEIDTSDSNWTMIYGQGNINFSSGSWVKE